MGAIVMGTNDPVTSMVEVFDPCTNIWSTVAPPPTARSSATPGLLNGAIHLVGGRHQLQHALHRARGVHASSWCYEDEPPDEAQLALWWKQASQLPGQRLQDSSGYCAVAAFVSS